VHHRVLTEPSLLAIAFSAEDARLAAANGYVWIISDLG
jgi:hypothetical protein